MIAWAENYECKSRRHLSAFESKKHWSGNWCFFSFLYEFQEMIPSSGKPF